MESFDCLGQRQRCEGNAGKGWLELKYIHLQLFERNFLGKEILNVLILFPNVIVLSSGKWKSEVDFYMQN